MDELTPRYLFPVAALLAMMMAYPAFWAWMFRSRPHDLTRIKAHLASQGLQVVSMVRNGNDGGRDRYGPRFRRYRATVLDADGVRGTRDVGVEVTLIGEPRVSDYDLGGHRKDNGTTSADEEAATTRRQRRAIFEARDAEEGR